MNIGVFLKFIFSMIIVYLFSYRTGYIFEEKYEEQTRLDKSLKNKQKNDKK